MKCSKRTAYYSTRAACVPSISRTVSERLRRSWNRPAGRHASEAMKFYIMPQAAHKNQPAERQ